MRAAWTSLILALSLTIASTSPVVAAGSESGTSPVFTIGPGHTFIAFVPGASSTLVRTASGISVSLMTSGLPDGHAVTVWALIFNDPTACDGGVCDETRGDLNVPEVQGSVFRVTGHVVGTSSSFGGHIAVGDAASAFRGPGLLNPYGAQIHLIVREHGVAGTGELLQQQFNDVSQGSVTSSVRTSRSRYTWRISSGQQARAAISSRLCPEFPRFDVAHGGLACEASACDASGGIGRRKSPPYR